MATLKFEIDTDEIYSDYNDGASFETLVKQAIGHEVKIKMQAKFAGEAFDTVSKNIALECIYQVDQKLHNLINEDIVMQDRWGKPEFIGSAEDYIKRQIDNKLLRTVDSNGKTLEGCALGGDNKTWINWKIEKEIGETVDEIERTVSKTCRRFLDDRLSFALKQFQETSLTKAITEKLKAVGVK